MQGAERTLLNSGFYFSVGVALLEIHVRLVGHSPGEKGAPRMTRLKQLNLKLQALSCAVVQVCVFVQGV